jgi:hypothetical protein
MGRIENLRSGLELGRMTGIEIGPLLKPVVTKNEGDIIYVDHVDTEALKRSMLMIQMSIRAKSFRSMQYGDRRRCCRR